MYRFLRPLLFRMDPERVHGLTRNWIRFAGDFPPARALVKSMFAAPALPVRAFGLEFPNPLGLAAGYDKDGLGWRGLACLGFGHIEIGTVTPRPQSGNPRPRVFRLSERQALINRMGFPGLGAEFVARQLAGNSPAEAGNKRSVILGVNLGKNKDTPLENAAQDYLTMLPTFAPLADYLSINVSSPNTVGLRRLQGRDALEALLSQVAQARQGQEAMLGRHVPVLVKLAPDLSDSELDDALDVILRTGMDGVIATNTTLRRDTFAAPVLSEAEQARAAENGGLSGAPLTALSTAMIRRIVERTGGALPVVGAGGVMNAADAREKLDAGAVLVQVYTGLVYAGPGLARTIMRDLARTAG